MVTGVLGRLHSVAEHGRSHIVTVAVDVLPNFFLCTTNAVVISLLLFEAPYA